MVLLLLRNKGMNIDMTKKQRIIIALDDYYIKRLDELKIKFNTKQYSKVIKLLLDTLVIK